jgi:lysophospholipase L1-like esterase
MRLRTTFLLALFISFAAAAADSHWVATWGTSPAPPISDQAQMRAAKLELENQTVRQIVHASIGGGTVRIRLSNAYGKSGVEIGAAHIALRAHGSEIVPGSDRVLKFGGRTSVTIPPGAPVLSDPVRLALPPAGDLAISLFIPQRTAATAVHYSSHQTSYIGTGDLTGSASIRDAATFTSWVFLTGVEVLAPQSASAVVAFGDSITDGSASTPDANRRWSDVLAGRLLLRSSAQVGVSNAGIGGNRILHDPGAVQCGLNALARFDRDVLAVAGAKYVIVLEGVNDLGHPGTSAPVSETVSAEDIIAGLEQMIERAHARGIKIFGATITPFEGTKYPGYFTPEKEAKRKVVNHWIRTSKAFDGVVDFDRAVRDPQHPDRMLEALDSGDHLHPGDAGYKAMGEAIDLALFR